MSLHSDVEALARALGVWLRATIHAGPIRLIAPASRTPHGWTLSNEQRGDGLALTLRTWSTVDDVRTHSDAGVVVDPPTAAIILLGHAHGLRVDLGECPACRERGSKRGLAMWEWAWRRFGSTAGWHSAGMDGADPLPGLRTRGDWESAWLPTETDKQRLVATRPCPECIADCKPTGRHTVPWPDAILAAMPKTSWVHRDGATFGPFESAGDPATRTALTVLADQAQARGDKLGDALAWWLAEPDVLMQHEAELRSIVQAAVMRCPACGGDGHYHPMPLDGMQASDSRDEAMSCTRCGGLGTVIRRQGSERVDHQAAAV